MKKCDITVIGSGVAGMMFSIKIAEQRPDLSIAILTKAEIEDSNSNYAQGGIAAVIDQIRDSYDAHIEDTLKSGAGLSDPSIVNLVIRSGPERIDELDKYGVQFTRNSDAEFDLALEGGHSSPRVVHSNDNTGAVVIRSLKTKIAEFPNITFYENRFCMELLKSDSGKIAGVRVLNTVENRIESIESKIVVLASGGIGQLYKYTTNPVIATGDGIALGIKAGAMLSNINYIQFHPTAFVEPNKQQLFLISEAVRGFGAYIVNKKGKRFLLDADIRGELATRDVVSQAIYKELKRSWTDHVYIDCRHLDLTEFQNKFPSIYSYLNSKGIKLDKQLIPVAPAAHYQCGGLKVNERAQTNIEGLYAIGECAETGLHGANRLASNSLLEALVFAHEAAEFILNTIDDFTFEKLNPVDNEEVNSGRDVISINIADMVKETMSNYATISSDKRDLINAKKLLGEIEQLFVLHKLEKGINENKLRTENMLMVSKEIVKEKLKELEINSKQPEKESFKLKTSEFKQKSNLNI